MGLNNQNPGQYTGGTTSTNPRVRMSMADLEAYLKKLKTNWDDLTNAGGASAAVTRTTSHPPSVPRIRCPTRPTLPRRETPRKTITPRTRTTPRTSCLESTHQDMSTTRATSSNPDA